jgi:pyrroline-5-carboxylate reductase
MTGAPLPAALPPLLLVGAGRMGSALFAGWARQALAPSVIVDPAPPAGVARPQDHVLTSLDHVPRSFRPDAAILAVKPQMLASVAPALHAVMAGRGLVISILAGKTIPDLGAKLAVPIIRAMPNTPAAIGHGITALCAGPGVTPAQRQLAETLLRAVGDVVWVDDEALIDPITAISGSGPAYVFLLAELMEQAGIEAGVPPALARQLARKTVFGAGALLNESPDDAADLRRAVTSPKGATEKALDVLMADEAWPRSIRQAMHAVIRRSREMAG